jgi:hypothetical protein
MTQESFSEAQIRFYVRDELRKILDSGLMMTETTKPAEREGTTKTPSQTPFQPSNSPPQTPLINNFPEELRQHLTIKDDKITCEYVSHEKWETIHEIAKTIGYTWISAGKDSCWRLKT